ncbi:hypothetical protein [Streptomyces sp. ME19-01-6]|uniref:hypothetical protein n=1 Tax=Streptomyces sp. ME19-01-6 TaxID=3028686 RepID=UPI0029A03283|nr:hypothetical protein [Streptomyces sp. ME19-01-6]MDX3233628.1 hypothetical protein [Streptomyces sp. ME19-01-6]
MAGPDTSPTAPVPHAEPLVRLYEEAGLHHWSLPPALAALYGGDLGFPEPCLYTNFVASLDGVVALGPEYPSSGHLPRVLDTIRARGHATILSATGPRLVGQLVGAGILNELFLTLSPVPAGREGSIRDGLIAGLELLPMRHEAAGLISARRRASYLFLRYRLPSRHPSAGDGHPGITGVAR